jgi:LysM repeat protein
MAVAEDEAGSTPVKASGKTHLVKKGETITKIAKQYKVTQDQLMQANAITDPTKLKAGVNLIVP